jgi:hypothetical protein
MSCSTCGSSGNSGCCGGVVDFSGITSQPASGFILPSPAPTPDNAFLDGIGRTGLRRAIGLRPDGHFLGQAPAPAGGGGFPSSTALSVAGAVALGLAGWFIAKRVSKDENVQLASGAVGAIVGLTVF